MDLIEQKQRRVQAPAEDTRSVGSACQSREKAENARTLLSVQILLNIHIQILLHIHIFKFSCIFIFIFSWQKNIFT